MQNNLLCWESQIACVRLAYSCVQLHRLGFRCRRPRWAVMRDDPQKAERMWAITQAILDAEEDTVVLIEDETIFKSLPPLRKMWTRIGQQVRIPTPFQNNDTCLYWALELNRGECVYAFHDKIKSENTIWGLNGCE